MIHFGIKCWDAWTPGIRSAEAWHDLLTSQKALKTYAPSSADGYTFLSTKKRRRLSTISKITLDVAMGASAKEKPLPSVFASRRGEVQRMAGLLQDICAGEDISPTAFSLSVHNTASGLFSIYQDNQSPSTAVAAGNDTVIAGLTEVCSQLTCGQDEILLVIAEDTLPELYQPLAEGYETAIAAAFVVTTKPQFTLEIVPSKDKQTPATIDTQVKSLLRLITQHETITLQGERQTATLSLL